MIVPPKSKREQELFEKYKGWLQSYKIPLTVIRQFKKDVRSLTAILLLSFGLNAQSSIVSGGNAFTIGEVFPIMQQPNPIVSFDNIGVVVYSEPIASTFTLKVNYVSLTEYRIYSASFVKVQSGAINKPETIVDISALKSGTYIIKIAKNDSNLRIIKK